MAYPPSKGQVPHSSGSWCNNAPGWPPQRLPVERAALSHVNQMGHGKSAFFLNKFFISGRIESNEVSFDAESCPLAGPIETLVIFSRGSPLGVPNRPTFIIFLNSMKNPILTTEKRDIYPRVGLETLFPGTPHTRRSDQGCALGGTIGVYRGSPVWGPSLRGLPVEYRRSVKSA